MGPRVTLPVNIFSFLHPSVFDLAVAGRQTDRRTDRRRPSTLNARLCGRGIIRKSSERRAATDRIVEVDVCANRSLMQRHHRSKVVAHRHLRVAGVSLHNFTHCFQLHTHTHTHTHTTGALYIFNFDLHSLVLA